MWQGNPDASGIRSIARTGEVTWPVGGSVAVPADSSDEALMAALVAGDELAFAALYDRYVNLVYSACLRVLADPHGAEDATQDIFVRLWRRPESFIAERGRFLSWLMSVSRNRAVDELRARGRRHRREAPHPALMVDAAAPEVVDPGPDPLKFSQLHEEQRLVRSALAELPAEQRRAIELAYFSGLTQQEISFRLHEPLGTVKTRIRLGMQKLRRSLDNGIRG